MPKHNLSWQATDVELLEALLLATGGEGGAPLQEVLLMADALEGAVLSLPELKDSLLRLTSVGFVAIQKNKLFLTPAFLETYETLTLQQGLHAGDELLLNLLQQQVLTAEKLEAVQQQELKKFKLKDYYQQYLEQFG